MSQIATTIIQSKQILEAGLAPDTADMCYMFDHFNKAGEPTLVAYNAISDLTIPAWSFSRIWDIIQGAELCHTMGDSISVMQDMVERLIYCTQHKLINKPRRCTCKIIRHKNPKGKTTWYRGIYYDEKGVVHKSPTYSGSQLVARRAAQNWLYANTHVWCNVATVEQRIIGQDGQSKTIVLRTEEII